MYAFFLALLPLWLAAANPLTRRTDANACTQACGGCQGVCVPSASGDVCQVVQGDKCLDFPCGYKDGFYTSCDRRQDRPACTAYGDRETLCFMPSY